MQVTINAQNAQDLKSQVAELHAVLNSGEPKTLRMSVNMPNGKEHKTELPVPAPEAPQGSIFAGEAKSPAKKATAAVKVPAPVVEEASAVMAEESATEVLEYTHEQAADELRMVIAKCGGTAARTLVEKSGCDKVSNIPVSALKKFIDSCRAEVKNNPKKK